MGTSRAGFILALIGGILGVVAGLVLFIMGGLFSLMLGYGMPSSSAVGTSFVFFSVISIYVIITAIVVIVASFWMKNPEKCFKASLVVLICSVAGGGGILGLIGGILGMVAAKQAPVGKAGRVRA